MSLLLERQRFEAVPTNTPHLVAVDQVRGASDTPADAAVRTFTKQIKTELEIQDGCQLL